MFPDLLFNFYLVYDIPAFNIKKLKLYEIKRKGKNIFQILTLSKSGQIFSKLLLIQYNISLIFDEKLHCFLSITFKVKSHQRYISSFL